MQSRPAELSTAEHLRFTREDLNHMVGDGSLGGGGLPRDERMREINEGEIVNGERCNSKSELKRLDE